MGALLEGDAMRAKEENGKEMESNREMEVQKGCGEPVVKELLQQSTPASGTACISLGVD